MGFLLTRRWVVFGAVVVVLAYLALQLGQWQFGRLEDRKQDNRIVTTNLRAAPVPVQDVLSTEQQPPAEAAWQRVTARGTWDDESTIVLKYQTRGGSAGVDVITPLVTEDGTAVLVDRGWLATDNSGGTRPELPPATEGTVTVTGYVRQDAQGGATAVEDLSTRAVSSRTAAEVVPHPLYRGFLDLAEESPEPEQPLTLTELPDAGSNGPHFFYGLQWWFFGALAVFGFGYLAFDEVRRRRRESQAPQQAAVHREHRAGHER
ncbi:SURF1 family cytochrome oxidase biogenesis protein [Nocardioides aurantiacus]|uniref:SURF1 family cytochrome oxidase biogenesis protein n=1 Tax=Nocardioides aurantiacus TaxID=86796 RepID=UPI00403EF710